MTLVIIQAAQPSQLCQAAIPATGRTSAVPSVSKECRRPASREKSSIQSAAEAACVCELSALFDGIRCNCTQF